MRDDNGWLKPVVVFIIFVIGLCIGFYNGVYEGIEHIRVQAVTNKHAEWKVNEDGTTEFKWKKVKQIGREGG